MGCIGKSDGLGVFHNLGALEDTFRAAMLRANFSQALGPATSLPSLSFV